jgi:hypothetical protein
MQPVFGKNDVPHGGELRADTRKGRLQCIANGRVGGRKAVGGDQKFGGKIGSGSCLQQHLAHRRECRGVAGKKADGVEAGGLGRHACD